MLSSSTSNTRSSISFSLSLRWLFDLTETFYYGFSLILILRVISNGLVAVMAMGSRMKKKKKKKKKAIRKQNKTCWAVKK